MDEQCKNGRLGLDEIANTSAIGIVQWEEGGRFSNPNNTFLRLIGRTREEMQMIRDTSELTPLSFTTFWIRLSKRSGNSGFVSLLRRNFSDWTALEYQSC